MLTITFDGKTYKTQPNTYGESHIDWYIKLWIEKGFLEELKPLSQKRAEQIERGKENKEMPDIVQREQEAKEGMKQVWDSIRKAQDPSILEKLREEIQRKATSSHWMERDVGRELLVFLTSLEQPQTKKEPTYMKSMGWKATPEGNIIVPQFTPGQEIEVSFDGEKWWKREYVNYEPSLWHFGVSKYCTIYRAENGCLKEKWEFARPIKIEPELPEVPDWKAFTHDGETYDSKDYQIEKLTEFCQALARQKTTK